ncbi:MAG TPA: ComEA family DNA-binding protein, partial [Candidatus Omnitrophota bacterium]|nr:ComEA family DNA-binding protein [Candidatus Omnitrophota bacterium]
LTLLSGISFSVYRRSTAPSPVVIDKFEPPNQRSYHAETRTYPKININKADAKEIAKLKHIGNALASRIVAYRQEHGYFISLEDIKKVRGIGNALFEDIKDKITLE